MKHITCIVLIFISFYFLWGDEAEKLLDTYTSKELIELVKLLTDIYDICII